MSKRGRAYIAINVSHELELQGIDLHDTSPLGPVNLFGMHMAFDPEASAKLNDLVTNFGWAIAARELPTLHAKIGTNEETDYLLELVVDAATHYGHQLLNKLTAMWLAED